MHINYHNLEYPPTGHYLIFIKIIIFHQDYALKAYYTFNDHILLNKPTDI